MLYEHDANDRECAIQRPACQVAGCFEPASVYVVIKESEISALAIDTREKQMIIEQESFEDINAFKLILYLCAHHDYDLKYLLKENELEITKRTHLLKQTE